MLSGILKRITQTTVQRATHQVKNNNPSVQSMEALARAFSTLEIEHNQGQQSRNDHFLGLRSAIASNKVEQVRAYIRPDTINLANKAGNSPIHMAVIASAVESTRFLIEAGADLNGYNLLGLAPIHLAALQASPDMLLTLFYFKDFNSKNPLNLNAISKKSSQGIEQGDTALHIATRHNLWRNVEALLDAKVNVNATDADRRTALHLVGNNWNIANRLLQRGAIACLRDKDGNTSLHANTENVEVMELLTQAPFVEINAVNHGGQTPYDIAKKQHRFETMLYLESLGGKSAEKITAEKTCSTAFSLK